MKKGPCVVFSVFLLLSLATKGEAGMDLTKESTQLFKLSAADGAEDDEFGNAVAVSSTAAKVVVGAWKDDDNGVDSGSVYVFDLNTGEQLLKLNASDGAAGDNFGVSLALSSDGAKVVVGTSRDDDNGVDSGSAYVFNVATGEQLLKLTAADASAGDLFGNSVAISSDGARVVIGANGNDDNGVDSGSAYVFDGATGEQLLKLVAHDPATGDNFAVSLAVTSDGAKVVVGTFRDDDRGVESGSAYQFDGATGEKLPKLLAADGAEGDLFGNSVSVTDDGAKVAVGASFGDVVPLVDSGSAYVFDGATGQQRLKLVAADGAEGHTFDKVAISSNGARVVVGACGDAHRGPQSGSAYVFDGATGKQLLKLVADAPASRDLFGISVAVCSVGARVVVGATGVNDNHGAAYVFRTPEGATVAVDRTMTWLVIIGGVVFVVALLGVVIFSVRKARQKTAEGAEGSAASDGVE